MGEYAIEFFSNESTTTEEKVKDIIDKTTRSFTEFNYDRQRFQAVETGRTEVMEVIESMDKAKHLFEETEPKMIDEEGNAIAPIDDGHSDIKDVRSRLDQLNSMLKGFKEKERDLREMVQNAVDEQFDAENLPGAHWYKANYDAVVV